MLCGKALYGASCHKISCDSTTSCKDNIPSYHSNERRRQFDHLCILYQQTDLLIYSKTISHTTHLEGSVSGMLLCESSNAWAQLPRGSLSPLFVVTFAQQEVTSGLRILAIRHCHDLLATPFLSVLSLRIVLSLHVVSVGAGHVSTTRRWIFAA